MCALPIEWLLSKVTLMVPYEWQHQVVKLYCLFTELFSLCTSYQVYMYVSTVITYGLSRFVILPKTLLKHHPQLKTCVFYIPVNVHKAENIYIWKDFVDLFFFTHHAVHNM